jgi:hypothetical protein
LAVALVLVIGSSLVAAWRLLPQRLGETLLAATLVAIVEVVVVMLLAGAALSDLSAGVVLACTALVAAVVAIAALPGQGRAVLEHARRSARSVTDGVPQLLHRPFTLLLLVLVVAQGAWAAFSSALLPPYAWDALDYHLPAVAYWIQQGAITTTPYHLYTNVYPMNTELTMAWPSAMLHSDALLNFSEFPFALLGALALVVLARAIGLRRSTALAVGCLFLLTPIVLQQLTTSYVDLAYGAELLACAAFAFRASQTLWTDAPDRRLGTIYLVLAGLAGGLALGSKGSGGTAIAVLSVVVLVVVVHAATTRRLRPGTAVGAVAAFVLPVLVLGTYWYARNWVNYDNPLYPVTIAPLGVHLFRGHGSLAHTLLSPRLVSVPSVVRGKLWPFQVLRSWVAERPGHRYTYDSRLGGFGLVWPLVAVPALVAFCYWAIRRRRLVLGALIAPFLVVFALQPLPWWSRYTIMFCGIGLLAIGWAIDALGARSRSRVALQALVAVLVLAVMLPAADRLGRLPSHRPIQYVTALIDRPRSERTIGQVLDRNFAWVDALPAAAVIATDLRDVPDDWIYSLFGQDFSHRVVTLHGTNPSSLERQIHRAGVDYVLTRKGSSLDRAVAECSGMPLPRSTARDHVYSVAQAKASRHEG